MPENRIPTAKMGVSADPDVVRRLMEHLTSAFEAFADGEYDPVTGEGLNFQDALMGCHNFYKRIILDLEERAPDCPVRIRDIAVATLINALPLER